MSDSKCFIQCTYTLQLHALIPVITGATRTAGIQPSVLRRINCKHYVSSTESLSYSVQQYGSSHDTNPATYAAARGDIDCLRWSGPLVSHTTSARDRGWLDWFQNRCVVVADVKFAESFAVDDVMVERSAGSYSTISTATGPQSCHLLCGHA
jgi:hypothetical protein